MSSAAPEIVFKASCPFALYGIRHDRTELRGNGGMCITGEDWINAYHGRYGASNSAPAELKEEMP